jgi:hypothetical protein
MKNAIDKSSINNPLIIYIAETDHGDMTYSSLLRKLIEDCDSKNLKIKVFSEFGNEKIKSQDEKLLTQKSRLSNLPDQETHDATTKILNDRSIPVGNLYERFNSFIPNIFKNLPEEINPERLLTILAKNVDNFENLKLLQAEIDLRKENEKNQSGKIGERNSFGKNGEDVKNFWGNGNAFAQLPTHQKMALDVIKNIKGDEDVVIMIVGAPHIYGLNQKLNPQFSKHSKIVIGNFKEQQVDLSTIDSIIQAQIVSGKKSCDTIAKVVSFDYDENYQAIIPSQVLQSISMQIAHKKTVDDLALDVTKISRNINEKPNSYVEKIRLDKTKGTSKEGSKEL